MRSFVVSNEITCVTALWQTYSAQCPYIAVCKAPMFGFYSWLVLCVLLRGSLLFDYAAVIADVMVTNKPRLLGLLL